MPRSIAGVGPLATAGSALITTRHIHAVEPAAAAAARIGDGASAG